MGDDDKNTTMFHQRRREKWWRLQVRLWLERSIKITSLLLQRGGRKQCEVMSRLVSTGGRRRQQVGTRHQTRRRHRTRQQWQYKEVMHWVFQEVIQYRNSISSTGRKKLWYCQDWLPFTCYFENWSLERIDWVLYCHVHLNLDCKTEAWKELIEYCMSCTSQSWLSHLIPASLGNNLEEIEVIICKDFPGYNHFDEMREKGLLWLTQNGYIGEICLLFLTSTVNPTIHHTKDIQGDCRDSITYTNINMCPAPNKCGGDHNQSKLQALTEDVLVEVLKLCRNAKISFFWEKPNQ